MGDEDRLFKELFEAFFGDLLALVVPQFAPHLDAENAEFIRDEMFADASETIRRQVDLLAKVPTDQGKDELVLVHVEVEGRAGSEMGWRMWQYAMLIRSRREKLPLIPLVVFLRGGKPGVHKETHTESFLEEELVSFHYFSFGLSGSSAEEHLERSEPLAWGLSTLMRQEDLEPPRHRLEILRRMYHAPLSWKRQSLLARCVEYYLELDAEERKEYREMLAEQGKDGFRSFENHWLNRMERAAESRGRQEGMQELLLNLLEQRFGSVPVATRHRVEALDSVDELTRLGNRVLTASSLEDLGLA